MFIKRLAFFILYYAIFHDVATANRMSAYTPSLPPPLRKVAAFHDLPSLATPERHSNPASYPFRRPQPRDRIIDESPLPLIPSTPDLTTSFSHELQESVENWLSAIADWDQYDMYRWSEKHGSEPSSPIGSPRSWIPVSRRGSWMLTPRRFALIFGACLGLLLLKPFFSRAKHHKVILSHFSLFRCCHLVC